MHMEHTRHVLDAAHLRDGQHVLMQSGRAAAVQELKYDTIVFRYLESTKKNDTVELTRKQVLSAVRI